MKNYPKAQRGLALLLFLFLAIGIGATVILTALSTFQLNLEQERKTQLALQQAKEAVIAWSIAHRTHPGWLPCPEDSASIGSPAEGAALSSCSNSLTQVGRIAWRTLGLAPQTDATGEQLWYVLSPGYRDVPPVGTSGVPAGQLQLDGVFNVAAALIIAPGPPLSGQERNPVSAAAPPLRANYLDMGNSVGGAFVSNGPAANFNDRVIAITAQDLYRALSPRVLAEIRGAFGQANGLRRYYNDNGQFPPAGTPLNSLTFDTTTLNWLTAGNWFSLITYAYISPVTAKISIGSNSINVSPCTALPCP